MVCAGLKHFLLHYQNSRGELTASKVEVQPEAPPPTQPLPLSNEGEGSSRHREEDPRLAVFLQTASFLLDVHALKVAT